MNETTARKCHRRYTSGARAGYTCNAPSVATNGTCKRHAAADIKTGFAVTMLTGETFNVPTTG